MVSTIRPHSDGGWDRVAVPSGNPTAVAAFPDQRVRHFQKQGSVKEELKSRRSPVQVELKLSGREPAECGRFGSPHWKCCSQSRSSAEVAAKFRTNRGEV